MAASGCSRPLSSGDPSLSSIDPSLVPAGRATPARLLGAHLDKVPRISLDDHSPITLDGGWRVEVGGVAAGDVQWVSGAELDLTLPALAVGTYDVRAISPSGASALLAQALEVFAPDMPISMTRDLSGADLAGADLAIVDLAVTDLSVPLDMTRPPPLSFVAGNAYITDKGPWDIVSLNYDRDTFVDLVEVNNGGSTLGVLRGNGDGTFMPPVTQPLAATPQALALGDYDQDLRADVAVSEAGVQEVFVNNPPGSLTLRDSKSISGGSFQDAAGDLDGDGRTDVVHCTGAGQIVSLLGSGKGVFQAARNFAGGGANLYDCVLADFDLDHKLDVLTTSNPNQLAIVVPGKGDGTFGTPVPIAPGSAFGVGAADLDSDGAPDIYVPLLSGASVIVLLNDRKGGFRAPIVNPFKSCGWADEPLALDLNGDGLPDMAVACKGSNSVELLRGDGTGHFYSEQSVATPAWPTRMVADDFNRDGRLDLAVTCQQANQIVILLNQTK